MKTGFSTIAEVFRPHNANSASGTNIVTENQLCISGFGGDFADGEVRDVKLGSAKTISGCFGSIRCLGFDKGSPCFLRKRKVCSTV